VKYVALSAAPDVRHILHSDEVRDAAAVVHPFEKKNSYLAAPLRTMRSSVLE
jgi:hypothetical protein